MTNKLFGRAVLLCALIFALAFVTACGPAPEGDVEPDGVGEHECSDLVEDGLCDLCGVALEPVDEGGEELPALKDFELVETDGYVYVVYPDGVVDPDTHMFKITIPELEYECYMESFEIPVNHFGLEGGKTVTVEITALNVETGAVSYTKEITVTLAPQTPPQAPAITVDVKPEGATLTITPVEYADYYQIYINGNYGGSCESSKEAMEYAISTNYLEIGMNEICVTALNGYGESEKSNSVSVGKLGEPVYNVDEMTIVNTYPGDMGYIEKYVIYDEDKTTVITTLTPGQSFSFKGYYADQAFHFPYIQGVTEGWISSALSGIPIDTREGGTGGGFGCATTHVAPTISMSGTMLTVVCNSYEDSDSMPGENFNIFVNGEKVTEVGVTWHTSSVTVDLVDYVTSGDVVTVKTSCMFEEDNNSLTATVTVD